jgi:hypothetical protein
VSKRTSLKRTKDDPLARRLRKAAKLWRDPLVRAWLRDLARGESVQSPASKS